MTSEEIRINATQGNTIEQWWWLAEIAAQLAELNERNALFDKCVIGPGGRFAVDLCHDYTSRNSGE